MSKFYDAFKLLCNMYDNDAINTNVNKLLNNATMPFNKYTELKNDYNTEGTAYSQILSTLSTYYNNLKNKRSNIPSLPGIATEFFAPSSSIATKLFIVLSIFGAIALF
ncbi:hypothetical protein YYC_05814 [Plasmodium yoelii 17X]|uniref:Plasmodium variant antigen protein Cir/Yir/Bir n=1 Tax=Plasmodium yoelii 17X TaxID=1323249 RepID=V7PBL4_PLAYE|nr:hypothetical protein YYC_05814 [Plasmodium yoelii 17X]